MKYFMPLLFLGLLAGGAYYSLAFFSRLSGVNMHAAMAWGFKAKRFELVLTWVMFYLIGGVMLLVLLQKPFMLVTMAFSHEGGLLGYALDDSEHAILYDPGQANYAEKRMTPPPPAAESFTGTFEVVAFYRPFLSGYGQNLEFQNIYLALFLIFLAALGTVLTYVVMYALADAYNSKMHLGIELSHSMLGINFQTITGLRFTTVAAGFVSLIVLASLAGGLMVKYISRGYEQRLGETRDFFRSQIMETVSPGKILPGKVIRRLFNYQTIYAHPQQVDRGARDRTVLTVTYTVEFRELTDHLPVYLSLSCMGDETANPIVAEINSSFPPLTSRWHDVVLSSPEAMVPRKKPVRHFKVNDDYTISLLRKVDRALDQANH